MKYENFERLTFEISIWVKKIKKIKIYKKSAWSLQRRWFFFKLQPKDTQRRVRQDDWNHIWKKSLEYENGENLTFEISILVSQWKNRFFLSKQCVLVPYEASYFSEFNQKMRTRRFFKMIKIVIEKQVSKVRKKSWNLKYRHWSINRHFF